jgi:hypothetical protein
LHEHATFCALLTLPASWLHPDRSWRIFVETGPDWALPKLYAHNIQAQKSTMKHLQARVIALSNLSSAVVCQIDLSPALVIAIHAWPTDDQ